MTTREGVSLALLTTFKIGGPARVVIDAYDESELRYAIQTAHERGLPFYVLGDGSNVLAADAGYDGVIIRPRLARVSSVMDEGGVLVIAEAGYSWDALVTDVCARAWWGIENLAGIPGTLGAAPIQNIGAYGAELADTLVWIEALDPKSGDVVRLPKEACAFGYRDSVFKQEPGLIIIRIALMLSESGSPRLSYSDLAHTREAGEPLTTPQDIARAVRRIRAVKFPDLSEEGTAGSFFKNPVLSEAAHEALKRRYPGLPGYPAPGGVKVPLAWILDQVLGARGAMAGGARLYEAQPLVIATRPGATAREVNALAEDIARRVEAHTGIRLEREVRSLP